MGICTENGKEHRNYYIIIGCILGTWHCQLQNADSENVFLLLGILIWKILEEECPTGTF